MLTIRLVFGWTRKENYTEYRLAIGKFLWGLQLMRQEKIFISYGDGESN